MDKFERPQEEYEDEQEVGLVHFEESTGLCASVANFEMAGLRLNNIDIPCEISFGTNLEAQTVYQIILKIVTQDPMLGKKCSLL